MTQHIHNRFRGWGAALFVWSLLLLATVARAQESLPAVLSAGEDREIKLWDKTGKPVATIGSHDDTIQRLVWIPQSSGLLASLSIDGVLKVWNVAQKRQVFRKEVLTGTALALAASPDGKLLATGGSDKRIRLWSSTDGKSLAEVEAHGAAVRALAFRSDGGLLVSAGADKLIRLWKVVEGHALEYQSNLVAHDDPITALALSPDDKMLASAAEDLFLKTWMLDGAMQRRVRTGNSPVFALAFSPDGKALASGDEDGKIRYWNLMTGSPHPFSSNHERGPVSCLVWTEDGKTLVSGGADKAIRFWNPANGQATGKITALDGAVRAVLIAPER